MIAIDGAKKQVTDLAAGRIRELRTLRGITQEQLALQAGLNPAFLGHIERSLKCPTLDTLNKIAEALHVSVAYLLDFEGERHGGTPNADAIERITTALQGKSPEQADRTANIVLEMLKL